MFPCARRLRTLNATALSNESAFRQEIDRTAAGSVLFGPPLQEPDRALPAVDAIGFGLCCLSHE